MTDLTILKWPLICLEAYERLTVIVLPLATFNLLCG